jgi:large subunit ribosomal protein L17
MRHRCAGRQFGRNSGHRKALFRSLVTSFFEHERIETTEAKAKEIQPMTEEMITLGKKGDLSAIRQAASFIRSRDVVNRLFKEIAPRFATRNGGYTRLVKTRIRLGDGAEMAILELIDFKMVKKEKGTPSKPEGGTETKTAGS